LLSAFFSYISNEFLGSFLNVGFWWSDTIYIISYNLLYFQLYLLSNFSIHRNDFHGQRGDSFRIARPTRANGREPRSSLLSNRSPIFIAYLRTTFARSLAKLARADRCTCLLTRARRTAGFRFPRKDAPSVRSTRAVEPGRNRRDRSGSTRTFTNDTRWRDFNPSRRPSRFRLRDYIKTASVRYRCTRMKFL